MIPPWACIPAYLAPLHVLVSAKSRCLESRSGITDSDIPLAGFATRARRGKFSDRDIGEAWLLSSLEERVVLGRDMLLVSEN
ncbi:hypothetical protein BP00DRAFT_276472 [Aspergillus indologenus CBS 114.80]|uniref:Uncharacterized protein n=1 Tax=Aspergillus indologenus CBS 114.80 TaxID=1450541 RepID=A0A2V5HU64_9EURO|nr:hypothetical protein BP00DRAFT_276472 [Aspergillus indologenus CBS 114.80]